MNIAPSSVAHLVVEPHGLFNQSIKITDKDGNLAYTYYSDSYTTTDSNGTLMGSIKSKNILLSTMTIAWETSEGSMVGDLICPWLFGPKEYTMHFEDAGLQYVLHFDKDTITVSSDLVLVAIYRPVESGVVVCPKDRLH